MNGKYQIRSKEKNMQFPGHPNPNYFIKLSPVFFKRIVVKHPTLLFYSVPYGLKLCTYYVLCVVYKKFIDNKIF